MARNLSSVTVVADQLPPLPKTLGGSTLTFNQNQLVPLFFVSPGQMNFQVPFFGVSRPTQETLTITQGLLSTSITVTVGPYGSRHLHDEFPGLRSGFGAGQRHGFHSGTPEGAFPGSRPIKKGEYLSLYCTDSAMSAIVPGWALVRRAIRWHLR